MAVAEPIECRILYSAHYEILHCQNKNALEKRKKNEQQQQQMIHSLGNDGDAK